VRLRGREAHIFEPLIQTGQLVVDHAWLRGNLEEALAEPLSARVAATPAQMIREAVRRCGPIADTLTCSSRWPWTAIGP
jgi:hypothetical protein